MKYTAGELAKKLGVSTRTVRFYDEKDILTPCGYSQSGYRLYDDESAERLQKILMLRFLDFSIEQIREMMKEEGFNVRKSLYEQEKLLIEKKEHIERILDAVKKAEATPDDKLWDNMLHIIDITKEREYVDTQYSKDDNLKKRISIHDYSTSPIGFYPWMLERIELSPGMKIMDIGCGNAAFWKKVAGQLPDNLEVHLTDYSVGMLESAKRAVNEIERLYPQKGLKFILEKRDAANFTYPVDGFDRIMANHMLYHVNHESRIKLYEKIRSLLSEKGRFSCTLIGKRHFFEMNDMLREYYPKIDIPSSSFDIWLETAKQEIGDYFTVLSVEEQESDLLVPDEELVFEYAASYSQEAKEILGRDKELFLERVRGKMNEDGCMYIHKSTGIVICKK